jgi:putative peptidoglycan lipid II flippase
VQGNAVGDAYLVANTAPNIIFELLLGGILSATLIPVFVERMTRADEVLIDQSALTRRERRKAAKASQGGDPGVGAILSATLAASLVASVLVVIFAPVVIGIYTASDSDPTVGDERAVAVRLLMLFAPQVLGYGFIAMAKAILPGADVCADPEQSGRHRSAADLWCVRDVYHQRWDLAG